MMNKSKQQIPADPPSRPQVRDLALNYIYEDEIWFSEDGVIDAFDYWEEFLEFYLAPEAPEIVARNES